MTSKLFHIHDVESHWTLVTTQPLQNVEGIVNPSNFAISFVKSGFLVQEETNCFHFLNQRFVDKPNPKLILLIYVTSYFAKEKFMNSKANSLCFCFLSFFSLLAKEILFFLQKNTSWTQKSSIFPKTIRNSVCFSVFVCMKHYNPFVLWPWPLILWPKFKQFIDFHSYRIFILQLLILLTFLGISSVNTTTIFASFSYLNKEKILAKE